MTDPRWRTAAFGLCLDRWGAGALWVSTTLGLLAFALLMALRHRPAAR